ncbi:hypothetical protein FACS189443_1750 [Planctomycetales bacterium]|nr:hypothetical protein FACS189443_1750 [Planctomycetales bacterium]
MSVFPEDIYTAATSTDWCLCIFFSVDIEGATAYKVETRNQKDGDNDWCLLFESFYVDMPAHFLSEYSEKLADRLATKGIKEPYRPILWKFVGDEILFYAPLTDARQSLEHLRAFCQAIKNYNQELKEQNVSVICKGTSWLAGFPINNRIILIPNYEKLCVSDQNKSIVDFIGSSIDCGFRLTKFSSARKLVISLDLLWMVAESAKQCPDATRFEFITSRIRYAGRHELKGVFSGNRYPVFWIDMLSDPSIEDKWVTSERCCVGDIIKFCEDFSSNVGTSDFIKPFIENDPSGCFCGIPETFKLQRQLLINYKEKAAKSNKQETADSTQSAETANLPTEARPVKPINDSNQHPEQKR